jgi:hypothetical protein
MSLSKTDLELNLNHIFAVPVAINTAMTDSIPSSGKWKGVDPNQGAKEMIDLKRHLSPNKTNCSDSL